MMVEKIAAAIRKNEHFLIVGHARPDGDSLGSALALAEGLRQLGKTVELMNSDPHTRNYNTLPDIDSIMVGVEYTGSAEVLVILECNNFERSGVAGIEHLTAINIDHHPKNDCFGVLNWVDSKAAAVAEMIYQLLCQLKVRITPEIATSLYVAILTDTGSFQYSNTTAETFQIASLLVDHGANPARIARDVFMNQPESRLRLIGKLLNTLEFDSSRQIAWIYLDQGIIKETGASPDDTEGLVNYPLSVSGVKVCAFFREDGNGGFRVSLRSKGNYDVGKIAESFGGGGHRNASGLTLSGTYPEVREKVVNRLKQLLG